MLIQGRIEKTTTTAFPQIQKKSVERFLFYTSFGLISFLIILAALQLINSSNLASRIATPANLKIRSLTDVSFTVSWETSQKATGFVLYGKTPEDLAQKAFDNSASGDMGSFASGQHTVTLTNLEPNTYYYYQVISNGKKINNFQGDLFKPVKTAVQSYLTNPSLSGNQP